MLRLRDFDVTSISGQDLPLSRSIRLQAGSPLTGLDRATCPPGNRTE